MSNARSEQLHLAAVLREHRARIRALEAAWLDRPAGTDLEVTDGVTSIDPASILSLDLESFTLTNPAAGEAHLELPNYAHYVPVLTSNATDPTLGPASVYSGQYVRLGDLAHVNGVIEIDIAGFSAGTGVWQASLPLPFAGPANITGVGLISNLSSSTFFPLVPQPDVNASDSQLAFSYPGSFPFGTYEQFPGPAGWVFHDGDRLEWSVVYETHD